MAKSKVDPLRPKDVTPPVILNSIGETLDELKDLYAVGVDAEGNAVVWSTGNLSGIGFAALVLQNLALKQLNGELCHGEE